mgnify:CR=1 FL=1
MIGMDSQNRISTSFAHQSMMTTLGARLVSVTPGQVEIAAPITPATTQQHGLAHAALAFAIGDSAAGYAALSLMPNDREVVTSEMKIHLLAPARGNRLIARGRVLRAGRRLTVVLADVYAETNGAETHVAFLNGTMVSVPA